MRIAVLSDIHDNVWNLAAALNRIETLGADHLVCCGDLCSPFIVDQLARGFPKTLDIVFGNNDADLFRITAKAAKYPNIRLRGEFFEETFENRRIAVNHFDNIAAAIAAAGKHDAVFYGHNHIRKLETLGTTLFLNPGSIMGCQFDAQANQVHVAASFAIYETAANSTAFYVIDPQTREVSGIAS